MLRTPSPAPCIFLLRSRSPLSEALPGKRCTGLRIGDECTLRGNGTGDRGTLPKLEGNEMDIGDDVALEVMACENETDGDTARRFADGKP